MDEGLQLVPSKFSKNGAVAKEHWVMNVVYGDQAEVSPTEHMSRTRTE
jgi:hypothetical protein